MRKTMLSSFFSTQDLASIQELTPPVQRKKNSRDESNSASKQKFKTLKINDPIASSYFPRRGASPQLNESSRNSSGRNKSFMRKTSSRVEPGPLATAALDPRRATPMRKENNGSKEQKSVPRAQRVKLADRLQQPLRRDGRLNKTSPLAGTPTSGLDSIPPSSISLSKQRGVLRHAGKKMLVGRPLPPVVHSQRVDSYHLSSNAIVASPKKPAPPPTHKISSSLGSGVRVALIPAQRKFGPLRQERELVNRSLPEIPRNDVPGGEVRRSHQF